MRTARTAAEPSRGAGAGGQLGTDRCPRLPRAQHRASGSARRSLRSASKEARKGRGNGAPGRTRTHDPLLRSEAPANVVQRVEGRSSTSPECERRTDSYPPMKRPRRRGNGPGAGHEEMPLMPQSDDSDAHGVGGDNEPVAEPTVRELLLDRIDEHCRLLALERDQVAKACSWSRSGPSAVGCHHDGVGDGRRDPAAGPRPPPRRTRTVRRLQRRPLG
jgi:hypothetical protein